MASRQTCTLGRHARSSVQHVRNVNQKRTRCRLVPPAHAHVQQEVTKAGKVVNCELVRGASPQTTACCSGREPCEFCQTSWPTACPTKLPRASPIESLAGRLLAAIEVMGQVAKALIGPANHDLEHAPRDNFPEITLLSPFYPQRFPHQGPQGLARDQAQQKVSKAPADLIVNGVGQGRTAAGACDNDGGCLKDNRPELCDRPGSSCGSNTSKSRVEMLEAVHTITRARPLALTCSSKLIQP